MRTSLFIRNIKLPGLVAIFAGMFFLNPFAEGEDPYILGKVLHTSAAVNINGRELVYSEVLLINNGKSPVKIISAAVQARDGSVLYSVSGDALQKLSDASDSTLHAGDSAIYYFDIPWKEPLKDRRFTVRFSYDTGNSKGHKMLTSKFRKREPIVLSAPLRGKHWAAVYSSEWQRGHRRVYFTVDGQTRIPGRFAIDFVKLDPNGRLYDKQADSTENYFGYGAEVLAVSDATVVSLRKDFIESKTIAGNTIRTEGDA